MVRTRWFCAYCCCCCCCGFIHTDLFNSEISLSLSRISRNADRSNVHFFSSHFFSALSETSVEEVMKWTVNKNINVFDKKFIFIPVNQTLHWSLTVIVNPGSILKDGNYQDKPDSSMPCILFFDSLKAHKKNFVAKKLHQWLNSEWKRLKNMSEEPFNNSSMKVYSPKSE
jgi:Ulp1 family protease